MKHLYIATIVRERKRKKDGEIERTRYESAVMAESLKEAFDVHVTNPPDWLAKDPYMIVGVRLTLNCIEGRCKCRDAQTCAIGLLPLVEVVK